MKVSITIVNWDKYQTSSDKVRHPHWLKIKNDLPVSESLYGLSVDCRWAWICILCTASKRKSGTVDIDLGWLSHISGVSQKSIVQLLKFLGENGTLTVDGQLPDSLLYQEEIRGEERRIEEIRVSSDASLAVTPGSQVWNSYSASYKARYGTEPTRNAKQNAMCSQIAKRIPINEIQEITEFYLRHGNGYYVREMHSLSAFLKDCEKIRTEWLTGRVVTQGSAQQSDLRQTNVAAAQEYLRREQR